MGSSTYPLGRTGDPITAEAKACLEVIIFGEEMGFLDLVVEGDALTIIKKIKYDLKDKSVIGNLIDEIKRKRSSFVLLSFEYTPQNTYEATHALVGRGHNLSDLIYWMEEVSSEVEPIIVNDHRRVLEC